MAPREDFISPFSTELNFLYSRAPQIFPALESSVNVKRQHQHNPHTQSHLSDVGALYARSYKTHVEVFLWGLRVTVDPNDKNTHMFSGGSVSKESACNAGDLGSIPGLGRAPGEGNPAHSSILTWRIPWTEEPGGLQSMGSQRVIHNWVTNLTFICFLESFFFSRFCDLQCPLKLGAQIRGLFCLSLRKILAVSVEFSSRFWNLKLKLVGSWAMVISRGMELPFVEVPGSSRVWGVYFFLGFHVIH